MKKKTVKKIKAIFGIKSPEPLKRKNFTQEVKNKVRQIQSGKCAFCHRWERYHDCHFDHIKGRYDHSITNCQMLCLKCHNRKTWQDRIKLKYQLEKEKIQKTKSKK